MATTAKWLDFSHLDSEKALAMMNGRLPGVVSLLLTVAIGWILAQLVWALVPRTPELETIDVAPPGNLSGVVADSSSGGVNIETIASAHLFGEASKELPNPAPPTTPTEDLEETTLALTLKGTMAGNDNKLTLAIIEDNSREEKIYSIGDSVTSGATLDSVYTDQVVLNRNGNLEALKLPKDLPAGSAPVRRPTASTRTAAPAQSASIQNVLTQNATKLADVIRPTPYFVEGQQQGYRVYPGRDRKQFAALGLRPGDLIKDIDGASLTDPQQAMQIFQNLGNADQVSVTVERNGQPEVLVLSTSQLDLDKDQ